MEVLNMAESVQITWHSCLDTSWWGLLYLRFHVTLHSVSQRQREVRLAKSGVQRRIRVAIIVRRATSSQVGQPNGQHLDLLLNVAAQAWQSSLKVEFLCSPLTPPSTQFPPRNATTISVVNKFSKFIGYLRLGHRVPHLGIVKMLQLNVLYKYI